MAEKRKAALGFIFITILIDVIGFGIIIPVLPQLVKELIHKDLSEAAIYQGWLMFAYSIVQFFCAPVLGALSDKYGRRPILLGSLLGFAIDYVFLSFASSILWLFIGRIIAGVMGASFTTASAYIADVSTAEKRAQNFGMLGMAFGLGFIIGPALGGVLGEYGARVPFMAAAVLTFLNFLYGLFILPESLTKENRRSTDWRKANPVSSLTKLKEYPLLTGLIGSLILIYIAGHAAQSTWTFFTIEKFSWSESQVGLSLAFVGLTIGAVQGGLIRFVIPKIGQKKSIAIGLALYAVGAFLFSIATQGWMMYLFMIPYALGGIAGPSLQGIISSQVPDNEQGELQGALTSLISVTNIVGPLLMSNLFAWFTKNSHNIYFPGAPFMAAAILFFFGLLLAVRSFRSVNQKSVQI